MSVHDEVRHELQSRGLARLVPYIPQLLHPFIRILVKGSVVESWWTDLASSGTLKQWPNPKPRLIYGIRHSPAKLDPSPIGISKIGGWPDIWPGFQWPQLNEQSLPFLAQFRLEDIAPFDEEKLLPHSGMLLIFFDFMAQSEGGKGVQILYFDGDLSALRRAEVPDNAMRFDADIGGEIIYEAPNLLHFCRDWQLAYNENLEFQVVNESFAAHRELQLSKVETENYLDFWSRWHESRRTTSGAGDSRRSSKYLEESSHQLLGIPPAAYFDERLEAVCQHHSFACDSLMPPAQEAVMLSEAPNWRLLLQFSSDNGLNWGDNGYLYLFIEHTALARRDFSNVQAVLSL